MKKSLLIILAIGLSATTLYATGPDEDKTKDPFSNLGVQSTSYTTAIGVRAIGTSGLTIKHFTRSDKAVEGIIGFWPDAFSATVLLEKHASAFDEPGLRWYYGLGGHLAGKSSWVANGDRGYNRANGDLGLGVDGIFGIEYKIKEVPIAVSLDVKPFLEVTTDGNAFVALDPGLGVKLTF